MPSKSGTSQTPGREENFGDTEGSDATPDLAYSSDREAQAVAVIAALGGSGNITHLDACITRLRVTVKDPSGISEAALKKTGSRAVVKSGDGVQVIYGTDVDIIKQYVLAEMKKLS